MNRPAAMPLLASPVRRAIMDHLSNLPAAPAAAPGPSRRTGLTAAQLAARLDLHITTVRFHVDQLLAAGLLVAHDVRAGVGRPRRHYAAHPGALTTVADADQFHLVAEVLTEAMTDGTGNGPLLDAEDAAERWVRRRAPLLKRHLTPREEPAGFAAKVEAITGLLTEWGYAAGATTSGETAEVRLAHCPILALAEQNPEVVCGIHRGLLRGALTELGEADAEIGLVPFVEPDVCLVQLRRPPGRSERPVPAGSRAARAGEVPA